MSKLKFKTNLNCDGCVSKVKPHLEKLNITDWDVDLKSKGSPVTVEGENINPEDVKKAFEAAGYNAEQKKGILGGIFG
ncbi:MAG: heavy-metal-associated domain-containing protein [Bacteroidales bacterium]|nr:heavy-metal-associated domain-containing protein [Bacteroidales bacterium]MCF8337083.1 heavy-metal-associated domain-containing protein [Bacteroidales bacterium]